MREKLIPIQIPPGLYQNGTQYQGKGRWIDANGVRFFEGTIQPIGGWRRLQDAAGADYATLDGCARAMYGYRLVSGLSVVAIGTTHKLYVIKDGALTDITPSGYTIGNCFGTIPTAGGGVYGAGDYGAGPYGGFSSGAAFFDADTWTLDSFGDYLVAVPTSDHKLYVWDNDVLNDAIQATASPLCNAVLVTPERFLVALGAEPFGTSSRDPRMVRWAAQETTDGWDPTVSANGTAGETPLSTEGVLIAGRRARRTSLLWTDMDLWTMTYIGPPAIYSFDQAGADCGLISPNAVAMIGTRAIWMGHRGFYNYDGYVTRIPCEISDSVFGELDIINRYHVSAMPMTDWNEIWWFYTAKGGGDNNRVIVYNYVEGTWTRHQLLRSCGIDRGPLSYPLMVEIPGTIGSGHVLEHESPAGNRADLNCYLESGPIEIGDGDQVYRLQRFVPDERTTGQLRLAIRHRMLPTAVQTTTPASAASFYNLLITGNNPIPLRITARQMDLFFREPLGTANATENWRLGVCRIGVIPVGGR